MGSRAFYSVPSRMPELSTPLRVVRDGTAQMPHGCE